MEMLPFFINSLCNPFTNEAMKLVCHSATDFTPSIPTAGSSNDLSHNEWQRKQKKSYHTARLPIIKWL